MGAVVSLSKAECQVETLLRRADRLFQIIQLLRARRTTTAAILADELGVSERTIYRDVRDLSLSGVPILGEAGVGYALRKGYELPPLMFDATEIEALVLGARMVQAWSDPELARAARSLIEKVHNIVPESVRTRLDKTALYALGARHRAESTEAETFQAIRGAVAGRQKVSYGYKKADGTPSERTVRPLGLFFWGKVWTLVAYCEMRDDYRVFRVDRIEAPQVLEETFPDGDDQPSLQEYMRQYH